jgi:hypothetical protein
MDDENPTAGEDDLARADEAPAELEPAPEGEGGEPETFELELDGEVHELPAALKGAFLRQADYTRKTQELAEHRRAVEAERAALAEHRQALEGAASDRAHLAGLDDQLARFAGVDWQGLSQADPGRAQALWAQFQQTRALRAQYANAVSHHSSRTEVEAAREAAERMAETGRTLQREIEGWSPEVAAKLVEYAQAFGVSLEELAQIADARLWKVLHKAYVADQASQRDAAARAQAVRPAVQVAGAAGSAGGVRDDLATREWMRRRNEQKLAER